MRVLLDFKHSSSSRGGLPFQNYLYFYTYIYIYTLIISTETGFCLHLKPLSNHWIKIQSCRYSEPVIANSHMVPQLVTSSSVLSAESSRCQSLACLIAFFGFCYHELEIARSCYVQNLQPGPGSVFFEVCSVSCSETIYCGLPSRNL